MPGAWENPMTFRRRAWILTVVAAAVLWTSGPGPARAEDESAPEAAYVGQQTCKLCHNQSEHGQQWRIWNESPHARAYRTLLNDESRELMTELGMPGTAWTSSDCRRCHVTAFEPEQSLPDAIRIVNGVQCESCHGPGSRHVEDGRKYWMEGDTTIDIAANIIRPREPDCLTCHNPQSPTWDPERYTLQDGKTAGFHFRQAFEKIAHPLLEELADEGAGSQR